MRHQIEQLIQQQIEGESQISSSTDTSVVINKVNRRQFLQMTGSGAGLMIGMQFMPGSALAFKAYPTGAE